MPSHISSKRANVASGFNTVIFSLEENELPLSLSFPSRFNNPNSSNLFRLLKNFNLSSIFSILSYDSSKYVTGQDIYFRTSNSSALDTTAMIIRSNVSVTYPDNIKSISSI